tara:strand:- start:2746 stop:3117 length:372 start_codon:yes stop_codon:yes gene_type:complete
MSSSELRQDVKDLLAEAISLAGSSTSEKIYVIKDTTVGGGPLGGGTTSSVTTLLTNAVFKSYDAKLFGDTILAGDRMLVSDNVTVISQGDTIQEGAVFYIVINIDIKAPTSDVLAYIAQVRLK